MTTTTAAYDVPQKPYALGVHFRLGPLFHVLADAVPVGRSAVAKETAFRMICPDCATATNEPPAKPKGRGRSAPARRPEPATTSQTYTCSANPEHGPYAQSDLGRAREMPDGSLQPVTPEEIEYIRTGGIDARDIRFQAHPVAEVDELTRPAGHSYRLRPPVKPKPKAEDLLLYELLQHIVESNPKVAFIGECSLKEGTRGLFRLAVWRGQLLMEQLIHPDNLAEADEFGRSGLTKAQLTASAKKVEFEVIPFDEKAQAAVANSAAARLEEVLAAKAKGGAVPSKAPEQDLEALLAASLGLVQGSKPKAAPKPLRSVA